MLSITANAVGNNAVRSPGCCGSSSDEKPVCSEALLGLPNENAARVATQAASIQTATTIHQLR